MVFLDYSNFALIPYVVRASKRRQESGLPDSLPFENIWGMLSHLVMSGFDNAEENVEFNNRVTAYRRMR